MNAVPKAAPPSAAARILEVSEEEYFADPCAMPSLSQSIAHILVSESPLHAWLRHPRLGNLPDESTKAKDEGSVIHKLLLGQGADVIVINRPDFRTNAAKEERDAALAAGKLPILAHKFKELQAAADRLRANCAAQGFEFAGRSEVALEWQEGGEDGPVVCRGRLDHVFIEEGVIYDVKKTRNANPRYLQRNFVELGYDIQAHAYSRALAKLRPHLEGRIDFVFLFMEIEPPYSVVAARSDGALREVGKRRWERAVSLWERCLARNHWPGYADRPIVLEAPPWVITQELGSEW